MLSAFLVCWFILAVALLTTASFKSKATVTGWLVGSKASVDIIAIEANGEVARLLVKNGQHVVKGQVLLDINRAGKKLNKTHYEHQMASLQAQYLTLQQRRNIIMQKYQHLNATNKSAIISYQTRLTLNNSAQQRQSAQLQEVKEQEIALYQLYLKQTISKAAYKAQKEKRIAIEFQLQQVQREKLELEQTLQSLMQLPIELQIDLDESLNSLKSNEQAALEAILQLKASVAYQITSPIDGVVHNLQTSPGQSISSQSSLLQIAPLSNPLKAILYVPSNHAGFIKSEDEVLLKLTAFPYQKFGMSRAKIAMISQQILLPHQINQLPIKLDEPVFLVEASLNSQQIIANGSPVDLKAGMLLQADIMLSERSLLDWLLNPLYSLRGAF